MNTLLSVLVGLGVGVGVGVILHFAIVPRHRRWQGPSYLLALIVAGGFNWLLLGAGPATTVSPQTEHERILQQHIQEFSRNRDLREAFAGLSSSEAAAKGRLLADRGIARLDDSTLRQRAMVMSELLAVAPEPVCAAIARGTAGGEVESLLATLPPKSYETWLQISRKAVLAEVRQTQVRLITEDDVRTVLGEMETRLSAEDYERLVLALTEPGTGDADMCWAMKTMYALALELPDSELALRVLVAK